MQNKITLDTFNELAKQGLLCNEHFLVTDHYFVITYNGLIHHYLTDMNYDTTGEIHSYNDTEEVLVIYINR